MTEFLHLATRRQHVCFETVFNVPNLRGDALVAIGDPHCHVVIGAPRGIEPAGDREGSRVPLDVEVLLLVSACGRSRGCVRAGVTSEAVSCRQM